MHVFRQFRIFFWKGGGIQIVFKIAYIHYDLKVAGKVVIKCQERKLA